MRVHYSIADRGSTPGLPQAIVCPRARGRRPHPRPAGPCLCIARTREEGRSNGTMHSARPRATATVPASDPPTGGVPTVVTAPGDDNLPNQKRQPAARGGCRRPAEHPGPAGIRYRAPHRPPVPAALNAAIVRPNKRAARPRETTT